MTKERAMEESPQFPMFPRGTSNIINSNGTAKHGCFAGFPGTGPENKRCRHCDFFRTKAVKRENWGVCGKYTELMGHTGTQIRAATMACGKFVEKSPQT